MTTWIVSDRTTGAVVHAYTSEQAVDWPEFPYATYNHAAQVVVVEQPAPQRRLSKLDYMQRFTDAELAGIYAAAKVSPAVEVWLAKFNAASVEQDGTSIDLLDPRTIAGVQALEAAGLIGPGRAAEILA